MQRFRNLITGLIDLGIEPGYHFEFKSKIQTLNSFAYVLIINNILLGFASVAFEEFELINFFTFNLLLQGVYFFILINKKFNLAVVFLIIHTSLEVLTYNFITGFQSFSFLYFLVLQASLIFIFTLVKNEHLKFFQGVPFLFFVLFIASINQFSVSEFIQTQNLRNFQFLHIATSFFNLIVFAGIHKKLMGNVNYLAKENFKIANGIINEFPGLVWVLDQDLKLLQYNLGFINQVSVISGKNPEPGMQVLLFKITESQKITVWQNRYNDALTGNQIVVNEELDGLYYRYTIIPVKENNQVIRLVCLAQNLTKQFEEQEELRKTKTLLESINKNIYDGIYRTNNEGPVYANNSLARIFGYPSVEEFFESNPYSLYKNPEDRIRLTDLLRELGAYENVEIKYIKKDGSEFTGLTSARKTIDESGKIYYDGSIRDISELIKVQEELEKARHAAEEASQIKSRFLSNMSHEIRTPLNAISGFALLLEEEARHLQLDNENIKAIQYSSKNLLSVVNDILDFSKIQEGKLRIIPNIFNIHEFIENIKHTGNTLLHNSLVKLEVKDEIEDTRKVLLDESRLNQIVLNLLGNAIKFTEFGSIQLTFKAIKCELFITVSDTGIGIKEEELPLIFDAFTQADEEKNKRKTGTGLGLTITRKLTELQSGKIWVESKYMKGTTFYVQLPVSFVDNFSSVELQPDYSALIEQIRHLQILIVEDNELNNLLNEKIFKKMNISVALAYSGFEALEMMENKLFDIVLSDIQMPEMDGFALFEEIKRRAAQFANFNVKVLAFTADIVPETREKIIQSGFHDILSKPFTKAELIQKIAMHCL